MILELIRDDLIASLVGFGVGFGTCWLCFTGTKPHHRRPK